MKYLASLLFITFLVSCSSNRTISESTIEKNTEQHIKKSYGPGGKIIYGNNNKIADLSTTDHETLVVEQNVSSSKSSYSLHHKQEKRKKRETLANQLATDFSKLKIVKRKLPSIGTSKASISDYPNLIEEKRDKRAKTGFILALVAAVTILFSFIMVGLAIFGSEIFIVLAILGLIAAAVLTITGFVFSISGLKSQNYKGLAIAGTIITGIMILSVLISFLASVATAY